MPRCAPLGFDTAAHHICQCMHHSPTQQTLPRHSRPYLNPKPLPKHGPTCTFLGSLPSPPLSTLQGTAFGPARTPLPPGMPPGRQAEAVAALTAIETAASWRQLPNAFSRIARLPAREVHLLALVRSLADLAPGEYGGVGGWWGVWSLTRGKGYETHLLSSAFTAFTPSGGRGPAAQLLAHTRTGYTYPAATHALLPMPCCSPLRPCCSQARRLRTAPTSRTCSGLPRTWSGPRGSTSMRSTRPCRCEERGGGWGGDRNHSRREGGA